MTGKNFVRSVWRLTEKIEKVEKFRAKFGYLFHIRDIWFQCHCTLGTLRVTAENFLRIVKRVFEKIAKTQKMKVFCLFRANFGYVSHIPVRIFSSRSTNRTLIWCRNPVEIFVWSVWRVFDEIQKSRKKTLFWQFLGLVLLYFSHASQKNLMPLH